MRRCLPPSRPFSWSLDTPHSKSMTHTRTLSTWRLCIKRFLQSTTSLQTSCLYSDSIQSTGNLLSLRCLDFRNIVTYGGCAHISGRDPRQAEISPRVAPVAHRSQLWMQRRRPSTCCPLKAEALMWSSLQPLGSRHSRGGSVQFQTIQCSMFSNLTTTLNILSSSNLAV